MFARENWGKEGGWFVGDEGIRRRACVNGVSLVVRIQGFPLFLGFVLY